MATKAKTGKTEVISKKSESTKNTSKNVSKDKEKTPISKDKKVNAKNSTTKPVGKKEATKPKPSVVAKGHLVSVQYIGTLSSGEEFDNSEKNGPISFIVGSSQVIKGFDDAVVGMKVNDKKKFSIKKEDAYGDINAALMHNVPLDKLPPELKPQIKVGGFLVLQSPVGQQIPAKVHSITDGVITLDLNHPLAGKDLTFDITVLDINIPSESDMHSHNHSEDSCCGDDCECDDKEGKDNCGDSCDCKH